MGADAWGPASPVDTKCELLGRMCTQVVGELLREKPGECP
jgi:hypothetical protein